MGGCLEGAGTGASQEVEALPPEWWMGQSCSPGAETWEAIPSQQTRGCEAELALRPPGGHLQLHHPAGEVLGQTQGPETRVRES